MNIYSEHRITNYNLKVTHVNSEDQAQPTRYVSKTHLSARTDFSVPHYETRLWVFMFQLDQLREACGSVPRDALRPEDEGGDVILIRQLDNKYLRC